MSCAPVEQLVRRLAAVVANHKVARDRLWAQNRCGDTRRLHMAVWQWERDHEYVRSTVVPLLEKTGRAILSAKKNVPPEDRYDLDIFSDNVRVRQANVKKRYLRGLKSAIRAGDLLRLPKRRRRIGRPA